MSTRQVNTFSVVLRTCAMGRCIVASLFLTLLTLQSVSGSLQAISNQHPLNSAFLRKLGSTEIMTPEKRKASGNSETLKSGYVMDGKRQRHRWIVTDPNGKRTGNYPQRYKPGTVLNRYRSPTVAPRRNSTLHIVAPCNGFEDFVHDVEVLSLEFAYVGFFSGSIAWVLHFLNQGYGAISVYLIGTFERLTLLIELIRPNTIPDGISNLAEFFGFVDYLINFFLAFPLGNVIIFFDTIGQILAVISLVLDSFATFNDVISDTLLQISGIDLRSILQDYGCDNPFLEQWSRDE